MAWSGTSGRSSPPAGGSGARRRSLGRSASCPAAGACSAWRRRCPRRGWSTRSWPGPADASAPSGATRRPTRAAREPYPHSHHGGAGEEPAEVGVPDLAQEGVVTVGRHVDRGLVDERVHVVERPVPVAAQRQALTEVRVVLAGLEELRRLPVHPAQDLDLHLEPCDLLLLGVLLD